MKSCVKSYKLLISVKVISVLISVKEYRHLLFADLGQIYFLVIYWWVQDVVYFYNLFSTILMSCYSHVLSVFTKVRAMYLVWQTDELYLNFCYFMHLITLDAFITDFLNKYFKIFWSILFCENNFFCKPFSHIIVQVHKLIQ